MPIKVKCKNCGTIMEESEIISDVAIYPQTNSLILTIECYECGKVEEIELELPEFLEIIIE